MIYVIVMFDWLIHFSCNSCSLQFSSVFIILICCLFSEQVEDTSEREVRLRGRVKSSIMAQLPEELDLYAGDLVNITHVVDKDWYRSINSVVLSINTINSVFYVLIFVMCVSS